MTHGIKDLEAFVLLNPLFHGSDFFDISLIRTKIWYLSQKPLSKKAIFPYDNLFWYNCDPAIIIKQRIAVCMRLDFDTPLETQIYDNNCRVECFLWKTALNINKSLVTEKRYGSRNLIKERAKYSISFSKILNIYSNVVFSVYYMGLLNKQS